MKAALVIIGVVLIVLGVVVAIVATTAQDPIRAAMAADCNPSNPNPFICLQDMSALGNWVVIFWGGAALVVVGIIVAVLGAVLAATVEAAPAATVAPVGPAPVAMQTAQAANCPRCGKPLAFVPQYGRWWCAAENTYI